MTDVGKKRVVWLYDGDHLVQPFIRLSADTLVEAGYEVSVLDRLASVRAARYEHLAIGRSVSAFDVDSWTASPATNPTSQASVGDGLRGRLLLLVKNAIPRRLRSRIWTVWTQARFLSLAFFRTVSLRPDIIIISLPSVAAVGYLSARLLHARLVYYPLELYGEQPFEVPDLWKRVERHVLRRGIDALVTQNEERGRIYVSERGSRVRPTIVHNYKPRRSVSRTSKLRSLLDLPEDCRIVLYEGWLSQGRWLDKLILTAPHLPDDTKLVFIGHKVGWWVETAQPLLNLPVIADRIVVGPWIPPEELLDYVSGADVGVIIYDDSVRNNYYCAPGKLSDYVIAGVPIVAPNFPTIAPIINEHRIGATFANAEPSEIAHAINTVLDTPREVWETRLNKARLELVWETQIPKLIAAVSGDREKS